MAKQTIESRLKALEERVTVLEETQEPVVETPKVEEAPATVTVEATSYPIPQDYRDAVNSTLNKSFGVNIIPMTDSPAFQFNIVVPAKYSPLTEEQRKMLGADIRTKVITYAEGVNGVKMWAEKVFSNFNAEVRALIVADKV